MIIHSLNFIITSEKFNMIKKIILGLPVFLFSCCAFAQTIMATNEDKTRLVGEIGLAAFNTGSPTRSQEGGSHVLPYVYATYGDLFARIDTLGIKVLPIGYGNLEISTRISFEGYKQKISTSVRKISNPTPIGISTSQVTPYGAFFAYGFYDPISEGTLLDMTYAAKFKAGSFTLFPQLGVEKRSAKYVQHLYGVTTQYAAASPFGISPYAPGASIGTYIGMTVDYPLDQNTSLKFNLRNKWFDRNISDSPLVGFKSQMNGFLAITHDFK
jgi:outer membrane protein